MPYTFGLYNFARNPEAVQAEVDAMEQAGWRVHTASMVFMECSIWWARDDPAGDEPAPHKRRAAQKHRENPVDPTSGGLHDHEGQDAR